MNLRLFEIAKIGHLWYLNSCSPLQKLKLMSFESLARLILILKLQELFFSMKSVHIFFSLNLFGSWNATVFNAIYSKTSAKTIFILQQWTRSSRSLIEIFFKFGEKKLFLSSLFQKRSIRHYYIEKKNFFTSIEERKKTEFAAMCLFLWFFCQYFHFKIKMIFKKKNVFLENFPSARANAHDVREMFFRSFCLVHEWNGEKCFGQMYTPILMRQPGSSKSRRQRKRETTQNAVYDSSRRLFEKHSAMYICDSEKTLFINIVLSYSRGRQSLYSLSLLFPLFFSSLYRIKWWIFACPCRLFQKHLVDSS